jgi:hypothetical protein
MHLENTAGEQCRFYLSAVSHPLIHPTRALNSTKQLDKRLLHSCYSDGVVRYGDPYQVQVQILQNSILEQFHGQKHVVCIASLV